MLLTQVSTAHAVSHFYLMTIPALIPVMTKRFDMSFVQVGFAITVFSLVSLIVHIPLGILTDRLGARIMLIAGLLLGGVSFASLAWFQSYAWLLLAMAAAGLANGVYHPAGYALLSSGIDAKRIGRAFSIYTFSGFLGTAVTPAILYGIVATGGIELAFIATGLIGIAVAILLLATKSAGETTSPGAASQSESQHHPKKPARGIFTPAVGILTVLFMLLSLSSIGMINFSATAFINGYGLSLASANLALTGFLFTSAFGVLAGGFLADRTERHGYIASGAFLTTGLLTALMASMSLSVPSICAIMLVAGFLFGVITPSRDMLVRAAAPAGAEGRVFGIVSTGLNFGGVVGPILFGSLLDQGEPRLVFVFVTVFILLTVVLTFIQELLRQSS
jgi:MFS transporter, FSR family, fosmidomycin resistance protein